MNLAELAKKDWAQITSSPNGFGREIVFTSPSNLTATVRGLFTKHHLGIDENGQLANSKTARFSISESLLDDENYPVRNAKGEVDLKRHIVEIIDSTGNAGKFIIREWYPDEVLGVILCTLGNFTD